MKTGVRSSSVCTRPPKAWRVETTAVPTGKVWLSSFPLSTRVAFTVAGALSVPMSIPCRCSVSTSGWNPGAPGASRYVVSGAASCVRAAS